VLNQAYALLQQIMDDTSDDDVAADADEPPPFPGQPKRPGVTPVKQAQDAANRRARVLAREKADAAMTKRFGKNINRVRVLG
jgi:hypothetical protein